MLFHTFTEDNCYTYALNDKRDPSSFMWFERFHFTSILQAQLTASRIESEMHIKQILTLPVE